MKVDDTKDVRGHGGKVIPGDHTLDFSKLGADRPIALLPVRLETRFAGRTLKVRIFPDQIHLDEHRRELSKAELDLGVQFWTQRLAATSANARETATAWLCAQVDPRRAAYVARVTRPAVTTGQPPAFPDITTCDDEPLAVAACLPTRWGIVGIVAGVQRFVQFALHPVRTSLAVAPRFETAVAPSEGSAPHVDAAVAWMIDYDSAVSAGMAITVTLEPELLADVRASGLTLLALGIRTDGPTAAAADLEALLAAHHYTDGLELVAQGTPTNNTDTAASGWTAELDDVDAWFSRELDGTDTARSGAADGIRLATALGLSATGTLARVSGATAATDTAQAAMNRVLWPVTLGRYLEDLLAPENGSSVIPASARGWLHDWFIAHVRGGAHLSAFAVGSQPYGVLPVRPTARITAATTAQATLENTILALLDRWQEGVPSVPRLDPVLGDAIGSDPEDDVVTILGSVPHASRLVVRRLTYQRSIRLLLWDWIWLELDKTESPLHPIAVAYRARSIRDVDTQLDVLNELRGDIPALIAASSRDDATVVIDAMISMVEAHRARQDPHQDLFPGYSSGVFSDAITTDPKLFWSGYGNATEDRVFTRPLVAESGAGAGARPVDYLGELGHRLGSPAPSTPLTDAFHANEPLLYQLIDPVIAGVGAPAAFRNALDTLAHRTSEELDLRLRETLGTVSYRLDAWITAFARSRLDELRDAAADGVHLGGFGWIEDLRPDDAGTNESRGFVHAPSLAHATTAAVLRSGWLAHGEDPESPFAVDLRSERVRRAAWLLDGMRTGTPLGELLGCRFERALHDGGASEWIDDCRRAVLSSVGSARDPRGPLDGLQLLDLYRGAGVTLGSTTLAPATAPPARLAAVADALSDLLESFDAVADASLADAVHHVLQGNESRAGAMLDAVATGEVPAPELRGAATPRPGVGVTHRLLVSLPTARGSSDGAWGRGPRSAAAPGLEAWCAQTLGDPARAACTVTFPDGGPAPLEVTMAELVAEQGISALDAIFEAAQAGLDGWTRRAIASVLGRDGMRRYEGQLTVDPTSTAAPVSFAELADLARAVHAVIARARALDARDLVPPSTDAQPGWNLAELEARGAEAADALASAARNLADALSAPDTPAHALRDQMLALARFGIPDAIPQHGWQPEQRDALLADAARVLDRANARTAELAALAAASAAADVLTPPTDEERLRRAGERFVRAFGPGLPAIARFRPTEREQVRAAFARSAALLGDDPEIAHDWLRDVAKVRAPLAALDDALALAALLVPGVGAPAVVAQLPDDVRDGWLARAAPTDPTLGRLALFAIDAGGIAGLEGDDALAGLVIDSWTERVPAKEAMTGLALHFDAPSSRPPQTVLLIVPRAEASWSFDTVVGSIRETMDLARVRAVDPDILTAYGHQLPAIFPPGALSAGPQPET